MASARMTISEQAPASRHVMYKGKTIGAGFVKGVFTPALVAVGGEVGKATGKDVGVVELLVLLLLLLDFLVLVFDGSGASGWGF